MNRSPLINEELKASSKEGGGNPITFPPKWENKRKDSPRLLRIKNNPVLLTNQMQQGWQVHQARGQKKGNQEGEVGSHH